MVKTKTVKKKRLSFGIFSNKRVQLLSVVLLFGVVGYFIVLLSNAASPITNAPAAPSIYFSPTTQSLGINETFTMQVRVNSGTTAINAVQANFTYPIDKFTYVSTSYASSAFIVEAENTINTVTGQVKIARSTSGGTSVTGDQQVATLTFTTKTVGGAANVTFGIGTALVAASTGLQLLPSAPGTAPYGDAVYTVDTVGPVVTVSAPPATIQYGSSYTIAATATDATSSVTKVEFYVDNVLRSTDIASPYSYAWSTTGVAEGVHTFTAKAFDLYNNTTTSVVVNGTVRDTIAPTVSITAPTAGSTLAGTIPFTATVADNSGGRGLVKVEFYVDNVLKSTSTASPYTFNLDTKTLTDAVHLFTAKAYDAAATPNVGTSAAVSATVDNSDKIPPTAPANLRSAGVTLTSIALAWDASTDASGISEYRLSRNGTAVYNGTALAYNNTPLTSGTNYTYSVVAVDTKGNVSAATTLNVATNALKVGDVNGDDSVNVSDLSLLISKWQTTDAACDLNKDGVVNIFDLSMLISGWGK